MAERVVDLLEVVEVDQHQRRPVGGVAACKRRSAGLEEEAPVAEPGETVRDRLTPGVEEALDLPEAGERPCRGEQQREGRQRHDGSGQLAE